MVRSLRPDGTPEISCGAQAVVKHIYLYDAQTCAAGGGRVMTSEAAPKLDPILATELNHEISRHGRLLHVLKSSMAAHVPTGLDAAAFGLLITLVKGGPLRQGELPEQYLLDPSTVSRH